MRLSKQLVSFEWSIQTSHGVTHVAFQCHVDYRKRKEIEDDNKRLAFLLKRKSEIRVEKYLARLRAAPLMRDHGNWDARESHGVNPVIQRAHGYRDLSDESMHAA